MFSLAEVFGHHLYRIARVFRFVAVGGYHRAFVVLCLLFFAVEKFAAVYLQAEGVLDAAKDLVQSLLVELC
jgi:hypothetical protein